MVKKQALPPILDWTERGQFVAGVDEVGRGPLAGPVVAAAVILDPNNPIDGLMDSKKITENRREVLAVEINEKAVDAPEIVNQDPYSAWLVKVKPSNLETDWNKLMTPEEYSLHCTEE